MSGEGVGAGRSGDISSVRKAGKSFFQRAKRATHDVQDCSRGFPRATPLSQKHKGQCHLPTLLARVCCRKPEVRNDRYRLLNVFSDQRVDRAADRPSTVNKRYLL